VSGRSSAAACLGLGAGAGALALAGALLHRTLRPTLEIRRYADDIAAAGEAVARNTDIAAELRDLRRLAADVRSASPAGSLPPAEGAG
jgi:hypothetical protein